MVSLASGGYKSIFVSLLASHARRPVAVSAGHDCQSFALSSVHLKSEANEWKPRMEQLEFLDSKVAPEHDTSVIVGDFNFLFKREEVRTDTRELARPISPMRG
jgi:endonuclease/exonuclease/phosphatase family metal-dependent hydrolase